MALRYRAKHSTTKSLRSYRILYCWLNSSGDLNQSVHRALNLLKCMAHQDNVGYLVERFNTASELLIERERERERELYKPTR